MSEEAQALAGCVEMLQAAVEQLGKENEGLSGRNGQFFWNSQR